MPSRRKLPALNEKQLKFANLVLKGITPRQAYLDAGYQVKAPNIADVNSSRLLNSAKVQAYLANRRDVVTKRIEERTDISLERTVRELAKIAYFNRQKLFREDGTLKPPSEWDDEIGAVIDSVESIELGEGEGFLKKVKCSSKTTALDMLMKHLGGYEKDNRKAFDVTTGGMPLRTPDEMRQMSTAELRQLAEGSGTEGE